MNRTRQTHAKSYSWSSFMLVLVLGLVVTGASVPPVTVMSDLETDVTADSVVDTRPATVLPAEHDEEDDTSASWNMSRSHRGGARRRGRTRRRKKATTSRDTVNEGMLPLTVAPASTETAAEAEVAAREVLKGAPGAVGTLPTPAGDAYNTPITPKALPPVQTEPSEPAVALAEAPTPAPVAPEVLKPVPAEAPTPAPIPAPTPALVLPEVSMPAPIPGEVPAPAPIPPDAVIPAPVTAEAPAPAPILPEAPAPAPAPAPVPTEASTPALVPTEASTPAPVPTEASTPAPVPTEASTPAPVPTEAPTPAPVPTEASTPAPVPTEASTPAPIPTEASMPAPIPTEAPTPGSTPAPAALTPTTVPVPDDVDMPLPPYNTTTEAPLPVPATSTPTTAPIASIKDLPLEDIPSPIKGSTSGSTSNSSDSSHYGDSTQDLIDESSDRTPDDSSSTSLVLTFAPIIADHTSTDSSEAPEPNPNVHHSNASTTSGRPRPLGGWKLALVVIGAICVVIASIVFVHMRHVRVVAANKRHRGSSQQRELDSFFRQNRVTVGRETGISSGVFVTDPLTPRDEIAVTMPMDARFQTQPVDFTTAAAAAPAYVRRPCTSGVLDTPTDGHQSQEFDSFTGSAPLLNLSSSSSSLNWSNSAFSDANSASRGSLDLSSQLPLPMPVAIRAMRASSVTFNTDVMRVTNRSEQSRSGFSVRFTTSTSSDDVETRR